MFWRPFLLKGYLIYPLLLQKEEMEPRAGVYKDVFLLKNKEEFSLIFWAAEKQKSLLQDSGATYWHWKKTPHSTVFHEGNKKRGSAPNDYTVPSHSKASESSQVWGVYAPRKLALSGSQRTQNYTFLHLFNLPLLPLVEFHGYDFICTNTRFFIGLVSAFWDWRVTVKYYLKFPYIPTI